MADDDQHAMRNPTIQYPVPPFEEQEQPEPGLAKKMKPKPDHGEESYVGSGRLKGRKALVTGGDSGIGRAAAIAFAREGADVFLTYLPEEEPDAKEVVKLIKAAGQKVATLPGDIADEAFCKRLVEEAVKELGGLDILVNVAGMLTSNFVQPVCHRSQHPRNRLDLNRATMFFLQVNHDHAQLGADSKLFYFLDSQFLEQ